MTVCKSSGVVLACPLLAVLIISGWMRRPLCIFSWLRFLAMPYQGERPPPSEGAHAHARASGCRRRQLTGSCTDRKSVVPATFGMRGQEGTINAQRHIDGEEEQEVAHVVGADAVVEPWAVVVEPRHAAAHTITKS